MPGVSVDHASFVGTPLTRTSCVTGPNSSVPLFHDNNTRESVTSSTDSPLGVDGAVVSGSVVTVTASLGAEALYWASNAVTLNRTV